MFELVACILVSGIAFFLGAKLLSGVYIKNFTTALILAAVLAILNTTLGLVLKVFTLGVLSLSIFTWLLDAIYIIVADKFMEDVEVKSFWWALGLAAIVSFLASFIRSVF